LEDHPSARFAQCPRKPVDRNLKNSLGQGRNPGSCPILRSSAVRARDGGTSPCAARTPLIHGRADV
jgi:hypothetical protein